VGYDDGFADGRESPLLPTATSKGSIPSAVSPGARRIRWRDFLGIGLDQPPPDHSTISRTRRLIALETHRAVVYVDPALSQYGRLG
jgi:hypothetical protein